MFDFPNPPAQIKDSWLAEPVGSRVTCNPPPDDTDEDWICFAPGDQNDAISHLEEQGFVSEGSPEFYTGNDRGSFRSLRLGDLNIILTNSDEFYRLFLTASHLAKRFNLLQKADRIALFQAVLYGVDHYNLEATQ